MIAPIVFTTTTHKETLRRRHKVNGGLTGLTAEYTRIMLDAFDIMRVREVQKDEHDSDGPRCEISYALEDVTKEEDGWVTREIQHMIVQHSMEEIQELMNDATREKKDWERE